MRQQPQRRLLSDACDAWIGGVLGGEEVSYKRFVESRSRTRTI
jgi:hypothetical protein